MELMTFEKGTPEEEAYIAAMLYCFEVTLRTWPSRHHELETKLEDALSIRSPSDRHISDVLELVRNFTTDPDGARIGHKRAVVVFSESESALDERLERLDRNQAAILDLFG